MCLSVCLIVYFICLTYKERIRILDLVSVNY